MPPEPSPWDRKDFFKERKYERSESLGSVPRWRSSSLSSGRHGSREFSGGESTEFRRNHGHGKQGGLHMSEELDYGYMPPHSVEDMPVEESLKLSLHGGDGRHSHNCKDRGPKDWRGHMWDTGNTSSNMVPGMPLELKSDRRSVDNITSPSHLPHSDFVSEWDQVHFKNQHNKRDNFLGSMDWKPLKWMRTGSLSSWGSGFIHSSSSKGIGVDSSEAKTELQLRNAVALDSPSGDATTCVTYYATPSDETLSRKKPRLGWGEGLAKYEKKKTQAPDENTGINGAVFCGVSSELTHSVISSLANRSPRHAVFSDCTSPTTPSSVACSSSPGMDDKLFTKPLKSDADPSNLRGSTGPKCADHLDGAVPFNLENMNTGSIANLDSSLLAFLQSDGSNLLDSNFMKYPTINKLLVWKAGVLKSVEMIESEIDSLENELKLLKAEHGSDSSSPEANPTVPNEQEEAQETDQVESESPGTATSKFVELPCPRKEDMLIDGECAGEVNMPGASDAECLAYDSPEAKDREVLTNGDDLLRDGILASNNDYARKASEPFSNLLFPVVEHNVSVADVINRACRQSDYVKEKFVRTRRFQRFKERATTLKFRAFQYLWKEDMRLFSTRRNRAKSQKRFELSLHVSQGGYQKIRSSIRSRISSPGSLSLVPTSAIVNFTSKLLSDPEVKPCRDNLKMPAFILDRRERMASKFVSNNGLVEDPWLLEKERAMINPWTPEEKKIFMEKLAALGKDFRKIASFLDHKTTADCVEFYYKNHKSDCFVKTKMKLDVGMSSNQYLVTSSRRWGCEGNTTSLDMLGAASMIAARGDDYSGRGPSLSRCLFRERCENEREAVAADVLVGICGSLSSEAMSCITNSADHRQWKKRRLRAAAKYVPTPEITEEPNSDTCSDESCGEMDPSDWTDEERSLLMQAVSFYGKDFSMIARHVRTRSRDQCKVFFSKARKCLGLDLLHPDFGNVARSSSDEGGGSDTDDACNADNLQVSSSKMNNLKSETNPCRFEEQDGPGHMAEQGRGSAEESDSERENATFVRSGPSPVSKNMDLEMQVREQPSHFSPGRDRTRSSPHITSLQQTSPLSLNAPSRHPGAANHDRSSPMPVAKEETEEDEDQPSDKLALMKSHAESGQRTLVLDQEHTHRRQVSSSGANLFPKQDQAFISGWSSEKIICSQGKGHVRSSLGTDKQLRNGNVKLFGQILSHPASTPENGTCQKIIDENQHDSTLNRKLQNIKSSGQVTIESELNTNYDGKRIHGRHSSFLGPATLPTKCPALFTNFPVSKGDHQHQLKAGSRSSEYSLKRLSVLPTRETSQDRAELLDVFANSRRRNGFESSLPISDPVVAIKRHYARTRDAGSDEEVGR